MKILTLSNTIVSLVLLLTLFPGCEKDPFKERDEYIKKAVNEVNADSLEKYVLWLQNMQTRFALADNHRDIAVKLKKKFISFGYIDTKLDSFYLTFTYSGTPYTTWQYNVIATLEGTDVTDSISIIGAHYDNRMSSGDLFNIVPGANDNASGVAAGLEIARLMKKKSFIPKYTIRFVSFAAEEIGLYGSYDYAQKAASRNEKIIMMLNNDMIASPPPVQTGPWTVNIINYVNSTGLRSKAEKICSEYTSLAYYSDNTNSNTSDSHPFYLNGFKPLFFIQKSLGSNYHTPNDVVSGCNFNYCVEIVKISYALLLEKNYR
jgi:Zn-dependent M28 family amino/carboxypeptidase